MICVAWGKAFGVEFLDCCLWGVVFGVLGWCLWNGSLWMWVCLLWGGNLRWGVWGVFFFGGLALVSGVCVFGWCMFWRCVFVGVVFAWVFGREFWVVFGDRVFRWGFVVRFWVGVFGVVGVSEVGELSADVFV